MRESGRWNYKNYISAECKEYFGYLNKISGKKYFLHSQKAAVLLAAKKSLVFVKMPCEDYIIGQGSLAPAVEIFDILLAYMM